MAPVYLSIHFCPRDKASVDISKRLEKLQPSPSFQNSYSNVVSNVIHIVIFSGSYGIRDFPNHLLFHSFLPVYANVEPCEIEKQASFQTKEALRRASLGHSELVFHMKSSKLEDFIRQLQQVLTEEERKLKEIINKLSNSGATVLLARGVDTKAENKNFTRLGYGKCRYEEGITDKDGWQARQWLQCSRVLSQSQNTIYINVLIQPFVRIGEFNVYLRLHVANLLCAPINNSILRPERISFTVEPCWPGSESLVPIINLNDTNSEESEYIRPLLSEGVAGIDWETNNLCDYPNLNNILDIEWALAYDMLGSDPLEFRSILKYEMTTSDSDSVICDSLGFSLCVNSPTSPLKASLSQQDYKNLFPLPKRGIATKKRSFPVSLQT